MNQQESEFDKEWRLKWKTLEEEAARSYRDNGEDIFPEEDALWEKIRQPLKKGSILPFYKHLYFKYAAALALIIVSAAVLLPQIVKVTDNKPSLTLLNPILSEAVFPADTTGTPGNAAAIAPSTSMAPEPPRRTETQPEVSAPGSRIRTKAIRNTSSAAAARIKSTDREILAQHTSGQKRKTAQEGKQEEVRFGRLLPDDQNIFRQVTDFQNTQAGRLQAPGNGIAYGYW